MASGSTGRGGRLLGKALVLVLVLVGALGAGVYWGQSGFFAQGKDSGVPVVSGSVSPIPETAVSSASVSASSGVASVSARAVKQVQFPDVQSVSRSSAESVARAAVTSLATWDTAQDAGYSEAVERTLPLFDASLAGRVAAMGAEPVDWDEQAVKRKAFSVPHVMNYEIYSDFTNGVRSSGVQARDGRAVQFFQLAVRWQWMGQDGIHWQEEGRVRVYELVMVQGADGVWSVGSYAWRDELPQM